jgi:glucose-6-phosphate isomerase
LSGEPGPDRAGRARGADWAARLREQGFVERLLAGDPTLWGGGAARATAILNRLGWVRSAEAMLPRCREFTAFAREVVAAGFTRVLLLGMGGSSLAPEVLARMFGPRPGGLPLTVLDDTSPAAVREALGAGDPARTLVLVSSKSGGTIEVTSFERAAFARAQAVLGERAGQAFAAITDPATALEAHARARGYRAVFTNPSDIGGRFSALSCFGLVPAALLGLDPERLCRSALEELAEFARGGGRALELGASLGGLALAGRDKLTLVLSPEWSPLGAWIEQLVAESTGKEGRGIVPVDDEGLEPSETLGDDRVFVLMAPRMPPLSEAGRLETFAEAGPLITRFRSDLESVGAEFLAWEFATAAAGVVLGVNPFDEPNVAEAKAASMDALRREREGGGPTPAPARATAGAMALHAPDRVAVGGTDEHAWAAAFLDLVGRGDYVALLAWMHRTPAREATLTRLRGAIRRATRAAVTLGHGPRYLHASGQLHKGGGAGGVFLQLTCDEGDEPIPGEVYGFAALRAAQAAGDYDVLARRGRRVARVHVSGDPDAGLERLVQAFERAASSRGAG